MSGGKLDRYLCLLGSRVRVAPAWNLVRGGVVPRISVCLFHTPFCYLAAGQSLDSGGPDSAGRTSRNERDGSDPPFFAAGAARKGVGLFQCLFQTLHPPFRGRFRPIYPCGKASDTNPQRALTRRRKTP